MSLKLCDVLRQWRWAERRELKEVAAEIGVGESTLLRFERGSAASGETLARVIAWLLTDASMSADELLGVVGPEDLRREC